MTQYTSWSYETWLRTGPRSPSMARMFVVQHLMEHGLAHVADDVRLVVSELATNVGVHTDTPTYGLRIGEDDEGVLLAVTDSSPSFLRWPEPSELTDLSGRGLVLTEALCRTWGVTAQPDGGKSVWATFAR